MTIKLGDKVSVYIKILDEAYAGNVVKVTATIPDEETYVFVEVDNKDLGMTITPVSSCILINED